MSAMPYAIPVLEKFRPIEGDAAPTEFCGTHRAVISGDKAYLQNLELIDEMDDGPMGKIVKKDLERFCEATNQKISEGQFPQMVVRHPRAMVAGDIPRDDSVGRVCSALSVRLSPETGRWTVYADAEFSLPNFRELVLSNKYPRRSVEITDDTLSIAQVAMLGRNRPAAGVRDVYFSGERKTKSVDTNFETRFEERHMTKIDNAKAMFDTLDDTEKAEFMKMCGAGGPEDDTTKDEDKDKPFSEDDDADKEKDKDKKEFSVANFEASKKIGEQSAQIETLRAQNQANERRLVELEVKPKLEAMFTHGGYMLDVEKELKILTSMQTAAERDSYFEHIRTHYRQRPTASSLVGGGGPIPAVAGQFVPVGGTNDFSVQERDRVVDFCSVQKEPITFEEGARRLGLSKKLGLTDPVGASR